MQPAIISGHTARYDQPRNWDAAERGRVRSLFVREETIGGTTFLKSAWETEQSEAGLLLAGAKLHLGIAAPVHPVVNFLIADLPDEFEPVVTARRFRCDDRGMVARVEALFDATPQGLRIWAERPIVAGFADAVASALESIEKLAKERGVAL